EKKEKKRERERQREREKDRERKREKDRERGSPTKEVLETAESLTRERNISKIAEEIHWQNTGNRLHCIFCISILPGPHSRTFSEVSSEMFLTGFGKTT